MDVRNSSRKRGNTQYLFLTEQVGTPHKSTQIVDTVKKSSSKNQIEDENVTNCLTWPLQQLGLNEKPQSLTKKTTSEMNKDVTQLRERDFTYCKNCDNNGCDGKTLFWVDNKLFCTSNYYG